ncbi:uncharacterized protein LOC143637111 [Bidens hawaiensis]|uniref:uncharacterized protein LOC143637111 n=1 Tax=Bidens hawaiensis TaxID=980011 RepID=UPI0040494E12
MQEVFKKEVLKLMDAGMIYLISDSPWKLNDATRKDHFPLSFIDQMSDVLQIPIAQKDQHKTNFIWPYGTFSYRRMSFGLYYVSKWVEAQALATIDARVVVKFLKKLFTHFGTPRAIISDRGTHFCNAVMEKALAHYGTINLDLTEAARKRYFKIHELEELRDAAYSRSLDIKEKTKVLHYRRLKGGKLRSKWTRPYLVKEVFPYGALELENPENGTSWKVNGHRL